MSLISRVARVQGHSVIRTLFAWNKSSLHGFHTPPEKAHWSLWPDLWSTHPHHILVNLRSPDSDFWAGRPRSIRSDSREVFSVLGPEVTQGSASAASRSRWHYHGKYAFSQQCASALEKEREEGDKYRASILCWALSWAFFAPSSFNPHNADFLRHHHYSYCADGEAETQRS